MFNLYLRTTGSNFLLGTLKKKKKIAKFFKTYSLVNESERCFLPFCTRSLGSISPAVGIGSTTLRCVMAFLTLCHLKQKREQNALTRGKNRSEIN